MYAPIGMFVCVLAVNRERKSFAKVLAILLATFIETLKLFQANLHPDPSNILIAIAATALAIH